MAALSPAIRSGPVLAVVIALVLATPAGARDAGSSHHYSIYGSLSRTSAPAPAGGVLQMQSHVSTQMSTLIPQSGEGFVLNAKLAQRPLGCGSDTIFANGFDP
jgi:predicted ATPase with chaperone activity